MSLWQFCKIVEYVAVTHFHVGVQTHFNASLLNFLY